MTHASVQQLVVATRSAGKTRELREMLAPVGVTVRMLSDAGIAESAHEDTLEAFASFEENALAKARWYYRQIMQRDRVVSPAPEHAGTVLVIADDSGLVVDALDGAPGVRSKRWSGHPDLEGHELDQANNAHLMNALAEAARGGRADRHAHYRCAAAGVWADGEIVVSGQTAGELTTDPRGEGGFGYDPYFVSTDLGITFGEATGEAKAGVSHRGRAIRSLIAELTMRGVLSATALTVGANR